MSEHDEISLVVLLVLQTCAILWLRAKVRLYRKELNEALEAIERLEERKP